MKVGRWRAAGTLGVALAVAFGATAGCGSPRTPSVSDSSPAATTLASSPAASPPAPTVAPSASAAPLRFTGHGSSDTSLNWAGYCAVDRHFTSITATWVQPKLIVGGARRRCVAVWVGLDGYNGSTVEQAGTEGESKGGAEPWVDCGAWWEMYPAPNHDIATARVLVGSQDMRVGAGETVTASVTRLSGDRFRLVLTNDTEGERFAITKTSRVASATTAEIIVEMPDVASSWGLAFFRPVRFTRCAIDGKPIGDCHWVRLGMKVGTSLLAGPSSLGADGASFTVWRH